MNKFEAYLVEKEYQGAYLVKDVNGKKGRSDYIVEAEINMIIAFRLNFQSNDKTNLTKVISGIILENDKENKRFLIETRNGLKYVVPYDSAVWVKTGNRWPKGVYDEMKQGAVVIQEDKKESPLDVNVGPQNNKETQEPDPEDEEDFEDFDDDDEDEEESTDYNEWTKDQLIAEANDRGIDVPYIGIKKPRLKREKLIELFIADDNITEKERN